jgi:hypothetical protein
MALAWLILPGFAGVVLECCYTRLRAIARPPNRPGGRGSEPGSLESIGREGVVLAEPSPREQAQRWFDQHPFR